MEDNFKIILEAILDKTSLSSIKSQLAKTDFDIKPTISVKEFAEAERDIQKFISDTAKNIQSIWNVNNKTAMQLANDYFSLVENSAKKTAKEQARAAKQAADIQYKANIGDYDVQINKIYSQYQKWGYSIEQTSEKLNALSTAYSNLVNAKTDDERITAEQEYQRQLDITKNKMELLSMNEASPAARTKLSNKIQVWLDKNTRASQQAQLELQNYLTTLNSTDKVGTEALSNIENRFKQIEIVERQAGRLGKSWTQTLIEGAKRFKDWAIASGAVMEGVQKIRTAVNELKEVDTLLTEISKANDQLSASRLRAIGSNSFGIASNYGKKATDYLSGVQEMSRAGYRTAEGMAELSTAAQGAGDMTAELANQYIIATDKAYKLEGNIKSLTAVLDGSNYITNNNAVNMTELAEGMSIVGSTASSFGVEVDKTTAALGTMIATTQLSGSEMARAFRAILLNIRQVSDEEEGIDAEGLTKYENACNALGVKLKETKNGVMSLRDPMEVINDLAEAYNKLDESDIRRTNLLSSVGGKLRATALDALLRQQDMYSEMLQQYADGTGSMAREAEKTANSWEGSLNRLSNTWTSTVSNFANTDAIITGINALNGILSVVDDLSGLLTSVPGLIAAISVAINSGFGGGLIRLTYHQQFSLPSHRKIQRRRVRVLCAA